MFNKPTYDVNNVQQLPDQPEEQSLLVKQTFDKTGSDTKIYLENLIDAISSVVIGSSGADNIGSGNIDGVTGNTVWQQLQDIKTQLNDVVLDQIPDGSLTKVKLAFAIADVECRQELTNLILKLEIDKIIEYSRELLFGFYDLFETTEFINLPSTTATVNTVDEQVEFDRITRQDLQMLNRVFESEFKNVHLRLYGDFAKPKSKENYTNVNQIEVDGAYNFAVNDKFVKSAVEYNVDGVSGSEEDVTFTNETPNASNNESGKNAVTFNGLIHEVVSTATGLELRVANDGTSEPTKVADISTDVTTKFSVAIGSKGGNDFLYVTWSTSTEQKIIGYDNAYAVAQAELIHNTVIAMQSVDLAKNDDGKLFVINSAETSSFTSEISEAEYSIATNGAISIDYAVTSVVGSSSNVFANPIAIYLPNNIKAISHITSVRTPTPQHEIRVKNPTWASGNTEDITSGEFSSVIFKKYGTELNRGFAIYENNTNSMKLIKNDTNGLGVWDEVATLTGSKPQLTENLQGDIHITYEDAGAIKTIEIPNGTTTPSLPMVLVEYDGSIYWEGNGSMEKGVILGDASAFVRTDELFVEARNSDQAGFVSTNMIDFTNRDKLSVLWTKIPQVQDNGDAIIYLSPSKTGLISSAVASFTTSRTILTPSVDSIDTSIISGNYYVHIAAIAENTTNETQLTIFRVYLDDFVNNPKTDGQSSNYTKPVCTYTKIGDVVSLAGEKTVGSGQILTLDQNITLIQNEVLDLRTQLLPKINGIDTTFIEHGEGYDEHLYQTSTNETDVNLLVNGKDATVKYLSYNIE